MPAKGTEVDFSTFVISLGSNAAMQLNREHKNFNLELAKQTIDILSMLELKTRGNLTQAEGDMLQGVIYQTRLAYNEAQKQ